jgi:ABC-type Fe3+/spermidine/putrescine transport system ATPase subunit
MNGLTIKNISKNFEETLALNGVSFDVHHGEIIALLGPSGCGKSTLLNIIAGLIDPDQGYIFWDKENLSGIPPHKRGFGLMFQDYLLFPHKNVAANIAFGLEMEHWSKQRIKTRVYETLKTVGLHDYAQRDVNTLSGGEQQRVALARALAPYPKLLMLDEPLGSLDRALRDRLLSELATILRKVLQTAIYVTHDQEEAFMLSDRVIVMQQGKVAQSGTPQEIYRHPASEFVARFLGFDNILEGQFQNGMLNTEIGNFKVNGSGGVFKNHLQSDDQFRKVKILLRPDSMRLDGIGTHHIEPIILESKFRGSINRVTVQFKERILSFEFPATLSVPQYGESASLSFFPEESFHILT